MLVLPTTIRSSPKFRSAESLKSGSRFSGISERQVVRTPRVESTSLTASGTPSQGLTPPFCSRASTLSARLMASSGVVVTKALISSSTSSTRRLATSAASRAGTSRASIFSASSRAVSSSNSFISVDPRDGEEAVHGLGGRREGLLARQLPARLVGAEDVGQVQGVRRRRDVLEVELLDLLDAVQDRAELLAYLRDLFVREPEPGQVGYVAHLLLGYHLSLPPALACMRLILAQLGPSSAPPGARCGAALPGSSGRRRPGRGISTRL